MSPLLLVCLTLGADDNAPTKLVVKFDVKAAASPRPALKYQLLPELRELETGTALQLYLKCFMEQNHFYYDKAENENREKWQQMPIKDLPVEKLRNYGGTSLRYADRAARVTTIDYQILGDLRREGAYVLLPEIQKLRALAAALKVRLRGEIADKRFDDAVGTIKTLYKLGHQLGEHPTLIGNLVGLAIVALTTSCVEEMIQQEGCPNLHWAFASLPRPLVSLRTGWQGERMLFLSELGRLERSGAASPENMEKALAGFEKLLGAEGRAKPVPLREFVKEQAAKPDAVKAARGRLLEYGLKPDAVKAMTPPQVILLDEQRLYEERHDDLTKQLTQPFHKAEPRLIAAEKNESGLLSVLLPNVHKVYRAQVRIEQRLKMLQVLEALRMHAAANRGELPKSLDDVDGSLPVDPISGKPFVYELSGGTAWLRGSPPKGEEKVPVHNVVYEVKIAK